MSNKINIHMKLITERLELKLQTPAEMLKWIESLPQEVRSEISEVWLSRLRQANRADPWSCLFNLLSKSSGELIGQCGFKGPPDEFKTVEITYGIEPQYRSYGYATESVCALKVFLKSYPQVNTLRAHCNRENIASERVLFKAGLRLIGEIEDPEDGLVNRWEINFKE